MTRAAVIIADIIVLGVTLAKTLSTYREAKRLGLSVPLVEIMVRDGQFTIALILTYSLRPED